MMLAFLSPATIRCSPFARDRRRDSPEAAPVVPREFRHVHGSTPSWMTPVMRVVRLRFTAGEKEFVLAVAQSRERQAALLRTGMVHEALAQTAVLLVAFTCWYGLTYVARPMKELQQHLDARSADDWTPLPEQLAPHEIAPLIASTNALIEGCRRRSAPEAVHRQRRPSAAHACLPRCVPRANCCSACRRAGA